MITLSKHCSNLSQLFPEYEGYIECSNLCEWLNIACGIVNVEFDTIRFNDCFGLCENAVDWDLSREEILEAYVTELTRFTYVWGALESLIDDFKLSGYSNKGKINSVCCYLRDRLTPHDIINPYPILLNELYSIVNTSNDTDKKILNRFTSPEYVTIHGKGLYVIYKLRNLFAHGDLTFPIPDENNCAISKYPKLILLSTRIVLLSIQMILMAYYKEFNYKTEIYWGLDDKKYDLDIVLQRIHLKTPHYDFPQYKQQNIIFR